MACREQLVHEENLRRLSSDVCDKQAKQQCTLCVRYPKYWVFLPLTCYSSPEKQPRREAKKVHFGPQQQGFEQGFQEEDDMASADQDNGDCTTAALQTLRQSTKRCIP